MLVLIALINTVVSLYYYLLIVIAMFINPAEEDPVGCIYTDRYNKLSIVLCTSAILLIGLFGFIYEYIDGISTGVSFSM